MIRSGQLKKLPSSSGVYLFCRGREILYIGKATNLRARVRSYFNHDLEDTRGAWLVKMLGQATRVEHRATDSVLEALILEAALIKKHQPVFNTKEKSDKSFNYVVITDEDYPKILIQRETRLAFGGEKLEAIFGPFPKGGELRAALKIVRKIFPFRDEKCQPNSGRPCFNYQIGLCPGVCVGAIDRRDYRRQIRHLKLFFSGRKKQALKNLEREMKNSAREQRFEQAGLIKKRIFALRHIQDVALIKSDSEDSAKKFRIEVYDVAHLGGHSSVGVMVVIENGELSPGQYRKFKLRRTRAGDDLGGLREILERRLNHPEWPTADLVVVDGGKNQLNLAKKLFANEVMAVVKDEKHHPREILGSKQLIYKHEKAIILANHHAHRFALGYHRQKRREILF